MTTEERLVEQFRGILGSGVTRAALRSPRDLVLDDIVINLHLFDRLFIAAMLIKQMRGYVMSCDWLVDAFSITELQDGLDAALARRAVREEKS